ncbi:hypothetical protein HOP50_03g20770 [Chloropicon primus]|uniref:IQ domain-containing protein n=1 Tax=Chloropicon primus TaxID=1764295 RepID=A0A5B8MGK2_9CHLO|nr:hypothetical protein A3770_03p20770 [Chloropicon primus]UPQ98771.1 hypothetical protein HOP50_03g20770 [Chloropicon primus]|eukprot:QDZ19559.1 hypothetical protein A3770_03p20770 [Chloropicon primus]
MVRAGAKLRAIKRCIAGLDRDIEDIMARGLVLAGEIEDCVVSASTSSRRTAEKWPDSSSPAYSHFPAIERGLRAKETLLGVRSRSEVVGGGSRSPRAALRDVTNRSGLGLGEGELKRRDGGGRARAEAAATLIQRRYRRILAGRRTLSAALRIQSHFRAYLTRQETKGRIAEKLWGKRQAARMLREWSRGARCRRKIRDGARGRQEKHGTMAHYHLGNAFDGDLIKPVDGIFAMAKEYQAWRMKAVAFVTWTRLI